MQRMTCILICALISMASLQAQTVPAGLIDAFEEGKARQMSEYFHQSLEMTILDKDYIASNNQATRIMENFFKENPPTAFKISFEGAKEESKYAIGELTTKESVFRVNIFFLNKEGKRLVYYLSIEKASEYELRPEP